MQFEFHAIFQRVPEGDVASLRNSRARIRRAPLSRKPRATSPKPCSACSRQSAPWRKMASAPSR
jgi:hypothetical protein